MRMAVALTAMLAASAAASTGTIVDLAVGTPDLSTLVAALKAADLVDTLSGKGPFTVFAPTNEAFASLPTGTLDYLLQAQNKAMLVKLLTYHVVGADIPSSSILHGEGIKSLEGDYLNATVEKSGIMINQAKVTSADNKASNGVIHIIDGVLTFPGFSLPTIVDLAVASPDLSTLVTALKAADLVDTLSGKGPFTVFAPTNEAFAALPTGLVDSLLLPENKAMLVKLLTYHVAAADVHAKDILDGERIKTVEGDKVMAAVSTSGIKINQAKVTSADNDATNGVVHIIDAVLTYPGFAPPATPAPAPKNIVELAAADPDLSTLVAALGAAQLIDTLKGPGPFTVFAPSNKAFASLPVGLVDSLLLPKNKATLVKLLTYHVAAADIHASDILDGERIKTVEGDQVMAGVSKKGVKINQAKVISADNDATNGVVHIIDSVLTYPGFAPPPSPPLVDIVALLQQTPDLGILAQLIQAANLSTALSSPTGTYTLFAPTDTVFESLPPAFVACLKTKSEQKFLAAILEYHVLGGELYASQIQGSPRNIGPTLYPGCRVTVGRVNGGVVVNGRNVTSADNNATNGVVHIIDGLLEFPYFPKPFQTNCTL